MIKKNKEIIIFIKMASSSYNTWQNICSVLLSQKTSCTPRILKAQDFLDKMNYFLDKINYFLDKINYLLNKICLPGLSSLQPFKSLSNTSQVDNFFCPHIDINMYPRCWSLQCVLGYPYISQVCCFFCFCFHKSWAFVKTII